MKAERNKLISDIKNVFQERNLNCGIALRLLQMKTMIDEMRVTYGQMIIR